MAKKTVVIDGVEMTFHTAHQLLWNWLAENQGTLKSDYFRNHKVLIDGDLEWIHNNCFACESCKNDCVKCPIILWRNDAKAKPNCFCPCAWEIDYGDKKDGLFNTWLDAMRCENYDEACKIAKEIADLEWEEV